MEGVERIRRCLNRTTENDPKNYVEQICSTFLDSQDKDLIYDKIVRLGRLQKSAYRHENEVYALVGVAAGVRKSIRVSERGQQSFELGGGNSVLCDGRYYGGSGSLCSERFHVSNKLVVTPIFGVLSFRYLGRTFRTASYQFEGNRVLCHC